MKSFEKPKILIVEDDPAQMVMLVDLALEEIATLMDASSTSEKQWHILKNFRIVKAANIDAVNKAVSLYKDIVFALVDCNIPDYKDGEAHDQFVLSSHRITGQHATTDIIINALPETPITMISSLNRFDRIINRYYEETHRVSVNFIRKTDPTMIQRNIGYYIRQYVRAADTH